MRLSNQWNKIELNFYHCKSHFALSIMLPLFQLLALYGFAQQKRQQHKKQLSMYYERKLQKNSAKAKTFQLLCKRALSSWNTYTNCICWLIQAIAVFYFSTAAFSFAFIVSVWHDFDMWKYKWKLMKNNLTLHSADKNTNELEKTLKKGSVFVRSIKAHPTSVIPFWDIDFSLAYSNFLHNFL